MLQRHNNRIGVALFTTLSVLSSSFNTLLSPPLSILITKLLINGEYIGAHIDTKLSHYSEIHPPSWKTSFTFSRDPQHRRRVVSTKSVTIRPDLAFLQKILVDAIKMSAYVVFIAYITSD